MADRYGVDHDEADALNSRQREALAAWADHDAPEGFADAVIAAWQAEGTEPGAHPRRDRARGRARRHVIGVVVGLAAAAMVLLMLRALPNAARSASVDEVVRCEPGERISEAPAVARPADGAAGDPAVQRLGPGALAVLTHHCMPCHDGDDPGAQAGALEVYDVQQPSWWRAMTDDQLREANTRIQELGASDDDERRSMAAFVDAELARRAHSG